MKTEPETIDKELSDVWCVDNVLELVCSHVGEKPAIFAVTILMAAAANVLGVLEKHQPGTLAAVLPGIVRSLSMSTHMIATSDEQAFWPSARRH